MPQPITISNRLTSLTVNSAVLQMFVDDFQAPVWGTVYEATINGVRVSFLEDVLNQLNQTEHWSTDHAASSEQLLEPGEHGQCDPLYRRSHHRRGRRLRGGLAKLLLNPKSFSQTGTIVGTVRDSIVNGPVTNALVSAGGGVVTTYTDATGAYALSNVAAGLVFVTASVGGFYGQTLSTNLVTAKP